MKWDSRDYVAGVDRGVLYPQVGPGIPWNGLVSIDESNSDTDSTSRHIDGVKTYYRRKREEFSGAISAYTYPDPLYDSLTDNWRKVPFGMSYRTTKPGGWAIHLVYNATISPGEVSREQLEPGLFSWNFSTRAVSVPGSRISAHLIIDTSDAYSWTTDALEDLLYGSESTQARLPTPDEVFQIFEDNSILKVIDNGDGTFTLDGPDEAIQMLESTIYRITWPSVVYISGFTYRISSL